MAEAQKPDRSFVDLAGLEPSEALNTVMWNLADALGMIPDGATEATVDMNAVLARSVRIVRQSRASEYWNGRPAVDAEAAV